MKANITRGNSVTDHMEERKAYKFIPPKHQTLTVCSSLSDRLSEITDEEKEVFRKFIQERLRPPFKAASVTHSNHFNTIGIES